MGNTIVHTETTETLPGVGKNRLEQVRLNMPEVRFYFSGDREQTGENLCAYIGGEALEFKSLQRFSDSGEGICYYVLLDVSASVSGAEFGRITGALSEFGRSVRQQDRMVCLTFGEEVKTLFDLSGSELAEGAAEESLLALTNPDQRTLLFEAISQMARLSEGSAEGENARRVAFVITDGEDIAKGVATKDEALQTLTEQGIPVYGFTVEEAKRDAVNAFGEFSRATGGTLTILGKDKELSGLNAVQEEILSSYEALFSAGSNRVSNGTVSVSLEFVKEGEKRQAEVLQNRWIKDTENPVITEAVSESPSQIRILFSEPVSGTDSAENYRLKRIGDQTDGAAENGAGGSPEALEQSRIPAYASPGSQGASVVLTFSEELLSGNYELSCENIRDCSMEQNPLTGTVTVAVEGVMPEVQVPEEPKTPGFFQTYGWAVALGAVILLAAGIAGFWRRLKKRSALVTVEGKAVLASNVETRHHVAVEQKQKLEEKEVRFHVAGQREEIPIRIRKSMIVGRSSACELIFDDPALSRQHFAIELEQGAVKIRNLSQSGFTTVNGLKLGAESYVLHPGDEIGAGQLKLTIRW